MLLRYLSAAALALRSAQAFRDASPFVLYSTSELDTSVLPNAKVASAQRVESGVSSLLKGCPSDTYVIVSQPGVSVNDLSASQSTPHLRRRLSGQDDQTKSTVAISNVAGSLQATQFGSDIQTLCGADKPWDSLSLDGSDGTIPMKKFDSIRINFPELPTDKDSREAALLQSDSYLNSLLSTLDSYTVIYTTTPASAESYSETQTPQQYEMDEPYPSSMHIDLKRDLASHARASNGSNLQSNLPLFEKYQFLSGGIFMGGLVSLLLLIILYVGISAIANLEVSYMAFSKEMGPAAQKKQQQ